MSKHPFAGRAADLVAQPLHQSLDGSADHAWQKAAEECVLARIKSLRIVGGLPRHKAPLSGPERLQRLQSILNLWAQGCTCAVDEDLFADILKRRHDVASV